MTNPPKRMSGTSTMVQWCNQLLDFSKASRVVDSATVKASYSPRGTVLAAAPAGSKAATATSTLQQAFFSRSFRDYILCASASDGSGTQYRIAKMPNLRNSITRKTYYGVIWNYDYPHNTSIADTLYGVYRRATGSPGIEVQGYTPPYASTDIIIFDTFATGVVTEVGDDGGNTPITLLERCDGRSWTRFANQSF